MYTISLGSEAMRSYESQNCNILTPLLVAGGAAGAAGLVGLGAGALLMGPAMALAAGALVFGPAIAGCNFELDLSAGVGDLSAEGKVFGVLIGAEAEAEATLHIEHSSSISTTRESETEISFSLGDPDDGDEIVVEIFHDPVFGSFVFDTISGRTRCRHEPNTGKSEGKFLFVFSCILI